jgi:hypothetical protein
MKKQLISILLILLFLTSCAALKTERKVVDNIFYSTFPKMKIKVNPDFKYMGKVDEGAFHEHEDYMEARGHPYVKEEKHVFVYDKDNSYSKKIIQIKFSTISGNYFWKLDFHSKWKNIITSGAVKIHGKEYYYAVQVTPENYIIKYLCRFVGDKLRIAIVYVENAGDYNNLSRTERNGLLKEFLDRSEKNIQILSDDATITGN